MDENGQLTYARNKDRREDIWTYRIKPFNLFLVEFHLFLYNLHVFCSLLRQWFHGFLKEPQISKINKWHLPKLQKQCKKIELQTPKSLLYTYKRLFCWRRSTKEHSCYLHCLFWHVQAQLKSHFCKSRQKCHVVPLWQKHHKTFHHSKRTVWSNLKGKVNHNEPHLLKQL